MTTSSEAPPRVPGAWRRRLLEWLRARQTVRMFRDDHLLAGLTAVLALGLLLPVFVTPFLPLVDLGSNIGAAGLLDDILLHRPVPSKYYAINALPIPYWTGYVIMGGLEVLFGAVFAAKATVALAVLLLPLAVMRLLVALDRSPRLGLWAFLLAWDVNVYWGWFTFQIGMSLAIYLVARLAEAKSLRDHAKLIPLTAVVGLSHVHATMLVGISALVMALVKERPLRALRDHAVTLSGFLVLIPWLVARALHPGGAPHAAFHFDIQSTPIPEKIVALYKFSLDVLPGAEASTFTSLAFFLLLAGPVALGAAAQRPTRPRASALAVSIFVAVAGLYLLLPFAVNAPIIHWWTYPRFATYVLLALLVVPRPDLSGRRVWLLAPGVLLVLLVDVARTEQFAAFGKRTRPYLAIIDALPRNSTFMPLDYAFDWPGTREWPLGQLHGYAAAAKSSYDPHLFDHDSVPILFRNENRPPSPDWRSPAATFTMDGIGKFYDYIITHPNSLDTIARLPTSDVTLVKESGEWRLYRVNRH